MCVCIGHDRPHRTRTKFRSSSVHEHNTVRTAFTDADPNHGVFPFGVQTVCTNSAQWTPARRLRVPVIVLRQFVDVTLAVDLTTDPALGNRSSRTSMVVSVSPVLPALSPDDYRVVMVGIVSVPVVLISGHLRVMCDGCGMDWHCQRRRGVGDNATAGAPAVIQPVPRQFKPVWSLVS